jgi:hypothetical protein
VALFAKGIKQPVSGTARVMSVFPREPRGEGEQTCHLTLNVQAPGVPAFTTEVKSDAPVAKWPAMASVLPVTVDRAKPERLEIEWARAGQSAAPEPTAAPPAPAVSPADASVLERLTTLRDKGVLTPVEFEQQKQRMLGG